MHGIALKAVSRSYSSGSSSLTIFNEANLDIPEGAFAVVCGPSGSGKSTLLNMIGGLDRPDAGVIAIDGTDIWSLSSGELARFRNETIGFVFQSFHLLPVLTAVENVAWPLYFQRVSRRDRLRIANEKLSLMGLADEAGRIPGKLSGGQRQRVAIARALVCNPRIVLADEPTANLDRRTAWDIIELMHNLNARHGVGFLCASHDPAVVERASEVISLGNGKIFRSTQVPATGVSHHA